MAQLLAEVLTRPRLPEPQRAREIRRVAGVTQSRLAHELHVHWMTVARWERGERTPRGTLRDAYARLLRDLEVAMQP